MSMETAAWLNTMTLIGFTDKRGHAWHYRESLQGDEPNHYADAIPLDDVRRRLFSWAPAEGTLRAEATILRADGVETISVADDDRKAIMRPPGTFGPDDAGAILGVFKAGYTIHEYEEWLVSNVGTILDDDLRVSSAGLLRGGGQAWVEVSVPESITTPEGVTFRPNLLAATSLDGTLATTYKRTITNVVCDNTMAAALGERNAETYKLKHTRYSAAKILDARKALNIIHESGEAFSAAVARLCDTPVSGDRWEAFLASLAPTVDDGGNAKTGRALTMAESKREELRRLYNSDPRVAPWKGSAWGVVQAVNTHAHHVQTVRGKSRAERNMDLTITGGFDRLDSETLDRLATVLA